MGMERLPSSNSESTEIHLCLLSVKDGAPIKVGVKFCNNYGPKFRNRSMSPEKTIPFSSL